MNMKKTIKGRASRILAGCLATVIAVVSGAMPFAGAKKVSAASYNLKPVTINSTNFPDPNFRRAIVDNFDKNKDNVLDSDELLVARNLWCVNYGIKDTKGIELITELRGLYCMHNKITSDKFNLSKNKLITGIWCSNNNLKTLDFSALPNLEWVYCFENGLTSLNVSNNPKLSYLEVNTNPLKKLDVSRNPLLEHLTVGSCELTTLDVTHNPNLQHLDAFRNHFKKLDVTKNPKLKRLDIWDNRGLGSIDITHNPGLQYYNCAHNDVKSIDVTKNPELNKLICSYNGDLKKLDISKNPKLVYLACECDGITNLDISNNQKLYFLQAFTNPFTKLNIGNNPLLLKTYKEGTKQSEYKVCKGHSWTIDYGGDTSTGGDNIYFLCFDDAVTLSTKATKASTISNEIRYSDLGTSVAEKDLLTREAVVDTLYKMAGSPSVAGLKTRFKDVKSGQWYTNALLWGQKNALCMGYPYFSSDTFGVGEYITRQDAVFMLMRYSEYKKYERSIDFGRSDEYIDYYDIDYEHWEAICWAATWNIMEGKGAKGAPKSEQRIDPYGRVTRNDFIKMVKNMFEKNKISTSTNIPLSNNGKANAHAFAEPTWKWNGSTSAAAKFKDKNNSNYVVVVDASMKTTYNPKPTINKAGKKTVTASVTFNGKTYKTSKTVDAYVFDKNITGLQRYNGGLYYTKNGIFDKTYNGKAKFGSDWYFVVNGKIDTSRTELVKTTINGVTGWYNITRGKVKGTGESFAKNASGWFYCRNGKVDFSKNDIVKGTVKGVTGWWLVKSGQVKFIDTVDKNSSGWWAIQKGKINFNFTGFAKNQNGWWYCENGKVNFAKKDVVKGTINGVTGWWFVNGGQAKFVDSVEKNSSGWWVIQKGKVNFNFNGIAKNSSGSWYCKGGKVQFGYTGTVKYNGKTYKIQGGKVVN
ncbi:S-layer homology domain-containing protein [Eubacterium ruminantium]|uniref:S-layer homology domain-containing protein n=1 Tax=Eubacterium ruminantium TaxID=42322 RepID=A0A1T4K6L2_9FIRM|nr:hypothetical protein [Eubacterium ruminantium]SCW27310.1 S-layer homology domain-containing protein [Eubacterium ruminantium]SDM15322.1 S-layer homology domain-containing protein [Eubacterium ruminantium]SJZ38080.1 S-layer homology domain-containing protein [Eubacterium ruminantium]